MAIVPAPKDQWYVVHVLSGQEQKVRNDIARRVEAEEMGDYVFEVLVPTERVSEVARARTRDQAQVLSRLHHRQHAPPRREQQAGRRDLVFHQGDQRLIGFAGTKNRPIPMRPKEVQSMLAQIKEREESVKPAISSRSATPSRSPTARSRARHGIVEEIDQEKGKLLVSVTIFGRPTPVELEYWQVEKSEPDTDESFPHHFSDPTNLLTKHHGKRSLKSSSCRSRQARRTRLHPSAPPSARPG